MKVKALDFVRTPQNSIAIVTETNHNGTQASIRFLNTCHFAEDRNAWWDADELYIIDNLPRILAVNLAHPFGIGKKDALQAY